MTGRICRQVWIVNFLLGEAKFYPSITKAAQDNGVVPTMVSRSANYRKRFKKRTLLACFSRADAKNALRYQSVEAPRIVRRIKSIKLIPPGSSATRPACRMFTKTKDAAAFLRINPHRLSTVISLIPSHSLLSYPVPTKPVWQFIVTFHDVNQ